MARKKKRELDSVKRKSVRLKQGKIRRHPCWGGSGHPGKFVVGRGRGHRECAGARSNAHCSDFHDRQGDLEIRAIGFGNQGPLPSHGLTPFWYVPAHNLLSHEVHGWTFATTPRGVGVTLRGSM